MKESYIEENKMMERKGKIHTFYKEGQSIMQF